MPPDKKSVRKSKYSEASKAAEKIRNVLDKRSVKILHKGVKASMLNKMFSFVYKNKIVIGILVLVIFSTTFFIAKEKDVDPYELIPNISLKNITVKNPIRKLTTILNYYESQITCTAYKLSLEKYGVEDTKEGTGESCARVCAIFDQAYYGYDDSCYTYQKIICACTNPT